MSRIQELFKQKQKNVLSVFCTAGFPDLESTLPLLKALQDEGADLVEIGMPYSDPLADGPVIQNSSSIAIANGMTLEVLFQQLKTLRNEIHIPIVLMGYMNTVLQYGFERFCINAATVGIDGLILPDLPPYEFETVYAPLIREHKLDFIFLVTPETEGMRVKKLDELSSGFLYAVSSSSTTGSDKKNIEVSEYVRKLKSIGIKNPVLVGFGIRDKASFDEACREADGAIIGTAFIKALENGGNQAEAVKNFMKELKAG